MKVYLLSIWGALMLSFVLSYSFTVKARLMGFNPNAIQPPQQPHALHNNNEVGNVFGNTHTRGSSAMKNKQIPTATPETNPPSTLKVRIETSLGHKHAHEIKEAAETPQGAAKIFPKRSSESKNESATMKKDVAVMAFRPSTSGHSPGIGHDGPPDPML